jgi:hypothetical protein
MSFSDLYFNGKILPDGQVEEKAFIFYIKLIKESINLKRQNVSVGFLFCFVCNLL